MSGTGFLTGLIITPAQLLISSAVSEVNVVMTEVCIRHGEKTAKV